MTKTADQLFRDGVRDVLGNQILQIVQLQAEVEILRARVVELEPTPEPPGVASTSDNPG